MVIKYKKSAIKLLYFIVTLVLKIWHFVVPFNGKCLPEKEYEGSKWVKYSSQLDGD